MIVWGIGKKDKKIIFILAISLTFMATMVFLSLSLFLQLDSDKLVCCIMAGLFLFILIVFLVIFILQSMTKDEVILFNPDENCIIINSYRKIYQIRIEDIKLVKVKNKGLGTIGPLIFPVTYKYGRLKIILDNGNKIITPVICEVESVYEKIMDK